MTKTEMTERIEQEMKGLSSSLEDEDYTNAIESAERETGWSLPQTSDIRIKWLMERSKRHLFFFLLSESASKFRFKNIHLQNRFEHYKQLVELMDKQFETAQEEFAYEFAGVSAYQLAGTKIDAGFKYDMVGRDKTYNSTNRVMITPDENS